jgi:hypothetical protein
MGSRTEQVTIYVTEERKTELEQRADDQDDSLSGIINGMIDQQLQQDAQDAIASEARAEERIQELIQVGTEEMTDIAREIRDMNAKFGAYSIANFELMKHDHTDHVRKQALSTGARRIRQDLDVVTDELAAVEGAGAGGCEGDTPTTGQPDGQSAEHSPAGEGATTETDAAGQPPATNPNPATDSAVDSTGESAAATSGASRSDSADESESNDDDEPGLFERLRSGNE